MPLIIRFESVPSKLFGRIYRPTALVHFKHKTEEIWIPIQMIVDTGADYSILPRAFARPLGIDLINDCSERQTIGIGGSERVFLYRRQRVRLGRHERTIPVGFLDREFGPALFGRHEFFETFKVVFVERVAQFINPRPRKRAVH